MSRASVARPSSHSASTVAQVTIVFHSAPCLLSSVASATDGFSTKPFTLFTLGTSTSGAPRLR